MPGDATAVIGCWSSVKRAFILPILSPVSSLRRKDNKWVVETPTGKVSSDWVIFATNAYSDEALPKLAKSVLPLAPIQIATDPLAPEIIDAI